MLSEGAEGVLDCEVVIPIAGGAIVSAGGAVTGGEEGLSQLAKKSSPSSALVLSIGAD